jgi:hypothetical protein
VPNLQLLAPQEVVFSEELRHLLLLRVVVSLEEPRKRHNQLLEVAYLALLTKISRPSQPQEGSLGEQLRRLLPSQLAQGFSDKPVLQSLQPQPAQDFSELLLLRQPEEQVCSAILSQLLVRLSLLLVCFGQPQHSLLVSLSFCLKDSLWLWLVPSLSPSLRQLTWQCPCVSSQTCTSPCP